MQGPNPRQGHGKNERFHRSLRAEVLDFATRSGETQAQTAFDRWRDIYNHHRPHQAIGMALPASRYRPPPWSFPGRLPEPVYDSGEIVRRVSSTKGYVSFNGKARRVSGASKTECLAIRPLDRDGL